MFGFLTGGEKKNNNQCCPQTYPQQQQPAFILAPQQTQQPQYTFSPFQQQYQQPQYTFIPVPASQFTPSYNQAPASQYQQQTTMRVTICYCWTRPFQRMLIIMIWFIYFSFRLDRELSSVFFFVLIWSKI